jgi:hypothetical protein
VLVEGIKITCSILNKDVLIKIFKFLKTHSCFPICSLILLIVIYGFYTYNKNYIPQGEWRLRNHVPVEVWAFAENKVARNITKEAKTRDAYTFARSVEEGIEHLADSGVRFSLISIVPNKGISTVWRYGEVFKKANQKKDIYVDEAIKVRRQSITNYSRKSNVNAFFIIDSEQSESNQMHKEFPGYNDFLSFKEFIGVDRVWTPNNVGQKSLLNAGINYGIFWFVKFDGESYVYEFTSTESHQIDDVYERPGDKIQQSEFRFNKRAIKDFQNMSKNPYYLYIKRTIGDKKINEFLGK